MIDTLDVAFATGFDFFERNLEVISCENDLVDSGHLPGRRRPDVFANRSRCRLAAERCEIGTDVSVRFGGQHVDIHVVGQRPITRVNVEYLPPRVLVRGDHFDVALDPSRPKQCVVDQCPSIMGMSRSNLPRGVAGSARSSEWLEHSGALRDGSEV